jgi:hypothetical protein
VTGCSQGGHNESYKDTKAMQIIKKIVRSITGFFGVVITGIIEGRQRQAEYMAKNHHWY